MASTSMSKQTSPSTNNGWAAEEKVPNRAKPKKYSLNRMIMVQAFALMKTDRRHVWLRH